MTATNELTLLLLTVFIVIAASYEYYEMKTGVAVFPSMPAIRRKIIEILKKDAEERNLQNYTVIDLGSGSGQMTSKIARAMPNASVIGIELSYIPWLRSVIRQKLFGPKNLTYLRLDFWPYGITQANAIITYLPGRIMNRVGEKLRKELKPGTIITANTFPLGHDWQPLETHVVRVPFKTNLYIYRQS